MGANIPLPALQIAPQRSSLDEYLRSAELQQQLAAQKQAQQQQAEAFPIAKEQAQANLQSTQQENQMRQLQMQDQQALRELAPSYVQRGEDGKVKGYDWDGLFRGAAAKGVSPPTLQALQKQHLETQQSYMNLDKAQREKEQGNNQWMFETIEGLKGVADPAQRQAQYMRSVMEAQKRGMDVGQFPPQAPSNDDLTALEAPLGMHAQVLKNAETQAKITKDLAEAGGPAGEREFQAYYKSYLGAKGLSPSAKVELAARQQYAKDKQPFGAQRLVIEQRRLDQADQRLEQGEERITRKDADFIDKNYVKPANDAEKSYQMFMEAYNNRNNAKTGAESMLALSTHLATTFGNVKGARVTKDMIEHHLGARGVSDKVLVAVQKLTNGDVLSPDQWDAFKSLISNSRKLNWETAQKEAKRRDVDISGSVPKDVSGGAFSVQAPNGKTYNFPDQASADRFKKAAGIQ